MRFVRGVSLLFYFFKEVVKANIQVAQLLFVPNEKLSPAIVAVPLKVKTDGQILLLSSMITLTPGTLSLDVSEDRSLLFVHVIHTADPNSTIKEIKEGFEKRILEVFP